MSDEPFEPLERAGCGDAALYALGLLRPDEARRFLSHAQRCVVCRDEISAFAPAVDALAESVPPLRAPAQLRGRVLEAVRAEAAATGSIGKAERRSGRRQGRWRSHRLALVGSSCATLAIGCALGALLIASPSSPKTTTVSAQVSIRGASAQLHRSGSRAWLTVSHMPEPGGSRIYEVWLKLRGGAGALEATSALFAPTSSGAATVAIPGELTGVSEVMVTAEPAGGTLAPTEAPVIVARV